MELSRKHGWLGFNLGWLNKQKERGDTWSEDEETRRKKSNLWLTISAGEKLEKQRSPAVNRKTSADSERNNNKKNSTCCRGMKIKGLSLKVNWRDDVQQCTSTLGSTLTCATQRRGKEEATTLRWMGRWTLTESEEIFIKSSGPGVPTSIIISFNWSMSITLAWRKTKKNQKMEGLYEGDRMSNMWSCMQNKK